MVCFFIQFGTRSVLEIFKRIRSEGWDVITAHRYAKIGYVNLTSIETLVNIENKTALKLYRSSQISRGRTFSLQNAEILSSNGIYLQIAGNVSKNSSLKLNTVSGGRESRFNRNTRSAAPSFLIIISLPCSCIFSIN